MTPEAKIKERLVERSKYIDNNWTFVSLTNCLSNPKKHFQEVVDWNDWLRLNDIIKYDLKVTQLHQVFIRFEDDNDKLKFKMRFK